MRVVAAMTAKKEGQPSPQISGLTHVKRDFSVAEVDYINPRFLRRKMAKIDCDTSSEHPDCTGDKSGIGNCFF
jgi:hypothetical protein